MSLRREKSSFDDELQGRRKRREVVQHLNFDAVDVGDNERNEDTENEILDNDTSLEFEISGNYCYPSLESPEANMTNFDLEKQSPIQMIVDECNNSNKSNNNANGVHDHVQLDNSNSNSDKDLREIKNLPSYSSSPHDDRIDKSFASFPHEDSGNITPPHKKFRSLHLYDEGIPHTPLSTMQKSQLGISRPCRFRSSFNNGWQDRNDSLNSSGHSRISLDPNGPQVNVNPFTPNSERASKRSANRSGCLASDGEDEPSAKKLALHEINTVRYIEEFHELNKLGDGEFGSVFECINRMDGCTYAIKKSKVPVAGSSFERSAVTEVHALAVLGHHPHTVRYFSAWAENDHMFIQNEYCNGGSVQSLIPLGSKEFPFFSVPQVKRLMQQVAEGLTFIHEQELVHMDLKPGNIFIQHPHLGDEVPDVDNIATSEELNQFKKLFDKAIYKIGDLGHVALSSASEICEEGDCVYLATEVLQANFEDLKKSDIFSFGLTVYASANGGPLPKNGAVWHSIREGNLQPLPHLPAELNLLLKRMTHMKPQCRPSAKAVSSHPILIPFADKTKNQLRIELNEEKFRNEILSRELKERKTETRSEPCNLLKSRSKVGSRLIGKDSSGKRVNRSSSSFL